MKTFNYTPGGQYVQWRQERISEAGRRARSYEPTPGEVNALPRAMRASIQMAKGIIAHLPRPRHATQVLSDGHHQGDTRTPVSVS